MPHYGINHESGTLKRVLVLHPGKELELANSNPVAHHFYESVDIKRFISDHQELVNKLKEPGTEVLQVREVLQDDPEALEQSYKCPNLVLVRDSSTMTSNGSMIFRMGLPSRREETSVLEAVYKSLDIPVVLKMQEPETFEGGGLALLEDKTAAAGHVTAPFKEHWIRWETSYSKAT